MANEQVGPGLFVKLGLDTTGLEAGLMKVKGSLKEWRDETNKGVAEIAQWGVAIGATVAPVLAAGVAVKALVEKYGAQADALKNLNIQTGISTTRIQEMQYVALSSGLGIDGLSANLNFLTRTMGDASDKSSNAYKAFMGLGVDPRGRTPDEFFDDLATAIDSIESPTQKAAAMQDIFGKNYKSMIPFIEDYIKARKEGKALGPIFTEKEISGLDEMGDELARITKTYDVYIGKVLAAVKAHADLYGRIDPVTGVIQDVGEASDETGDSLDYLAEDLEEAGEAAKKLADDAMTARRKLEDLYRTIDRSSETSQNAGEEQRSAGDEYNALMQQRKVLVGQYSNIGEKTSGDIELDAKIKELDEKIRAAARRYRGATSNLVDAGIERDRAREDITAAETPSSGFMAGYAPVYTKSQVTAALTPHATVDGKPIYVTIYQTNTGVISDTQISKGAGRVIANGSALP